MKITRVEAIPIRLPLRKPMLMGGRTYETCESVLVRLETTGRAVGWGEAAVAPALTGETTSSILATVPMLAEQVIGLDARDITALRQRMRRAILGNTAAKAALDMALHDVVARGIDWPVYRLIGGKVSERLECLWLVGNSDASQDMAEAHAKANQGFRRLKLKVANGELEQEAETLIAIRKSIGSKVQLCADANGNWRVSEATRFTRLVEPAYPDFLEQPVAGDDLDGLRQVARASPVPIGADESLHDLHHMRQLIETGAARGGSFKVMKFEGIAPCLHAMRMCRSLGGEVNLSGKLGETSIGNAATLALAAAFGPPSWGLSLTNHYLQQDIVYQPIAVTNGTVRPSDEPGLGTEVNESALAKLEYWPGERVQHSNKSQGLVAAEAS